MINIIQKPQFKIYRDGKYDAVATWKPAILSQVKSISNATEKRIDRWFVEHKF